VEARGLVLAGALVSRAQQSGQRLGHGGRGGGRGRRVGEDRGATGGDRGVVGGRRESGGGRTVGSGGGKRAGHGSADLSRVRERRAGARNVFWDKAITSVGHP
jgi:hypothetical protein